MGVMLSELQACLDELLQPTSISDYCPNGLQVEGRAQISRLVTGVTASQALLDAAVAADADAILVHHGYFWKGENPCIRGIKKRRLATLLAHDISLLAYHLPIDLHPQFGNNAQLAARLGISIEGGLEPDNPRSIGLYGRLAAPLTAIQLADLLEQTLGRRPEHIEGGPALIERVGWCTGAAQGYIGQAIDRGLDAYISGEISEPTVHDAREGQVHYFAAGHHATERYGVQAVGEYLSETLGIEHRFIDIANPV